MHQRHQTSNRRSNAEKLLQIEEKVKEKRESSWLPNWVWSKSPPGTPYNYYYYCKKPWELISSYWNMFITFYERGRRGIAVTDSYSLDSYLQKVIVLGIDQMLSETPDGPPTHPTQISHQEWVEILTTIRDGYDVGWEEQPSDEGFALLQKWWQHLWT